jgi:hypothetical protein
MSSASYTVATGVTGDPTAPGNRNGGAVRRKRFRPASRNHEANCEHSDNPVFSSVI